MQVHDVIVIGGGVIGCAIARELSRYDIDSILLEKECDVGAGISGRTSGVAHAGFYIQPGTLKAELNIKGHMRLPSLCTELDVPYKEIGKLVVAKNDNEIPYLKKLKSVGEKNGTRKLKIIDKEEVRRLEPNIEAALALHSPTSGIIDPFELTIALAENALENGVNFSLSTKVQDITRKDDLFTVKTNRGEYTSKLIVNSAGLFSDRVAEMAGIYRYKIYPCRGQYHIIDKNKSHLINHLIYPVPPEDVGGLGIHLTPTTHGNILIGPSAEYICEPETSTTCEVMDQLYNEAKEMLPSINKRDFIRSFAGVRPKLTCPGSLDPADFVIEEDSEVSGFINLIGIESPGLTAAPAIAEKVCEIINESTQLKTKKDHNPRRKRPPRFNQLTDEEKAKLICENPDYGQIICRCETITRKEILDALNNPLKVKNIDAIKRRCRAGMGRCQGGFCLPKIAQIMEESGGVKADEIRLNCEGSELFVGKTKDFRRK